MWNDARSAADVELRALYKKYADVVAVQALDLRVEPGAFVSLLGPSGCGKTTTLRAIAGLVRPDSGEVRIAGRLMNDIPVHRRGLGLVAQNYALFPHMTVLENVTFGLRMRRVSESEALRRARAALSTVQLTALEDRYPRQLSGGQQQRVALARCFVVEPQVLLLDEPLGALDRKLRQSMQVELKALQRQVGITTIFVTHDQEEALTMSDRIAVMHDGRLQQFGTPRDIYENPHNRFVAEFVGVCNFLPCRLEAREQSALLLRLEDGSLLRCRASNACPPIGARVTIAIRPERIMVGPRGSDIEGGFRGILENLVYVGNALHLYLRTTGGTPLIAYQQNSTTVAADLAPGAEVRAWWQPDSARLIVD
jgi:putative spermidine/putrescine transport system ATP-binding protein